MQRSLFAVFLATLVCFAQSVLADDSLPGIKLDRVSFSGYGSLVNTRVEGYNYFHTPYPPEWYSNSVLNLVAHFKLADHFTGHLGIEEYTYTNNIPNNAGFFTNNIRQEVYFNVYPHQIEGDYTFGDPRTLNGEAAFGYFPYKYDSNAWNLGEYLFRSGTYPGYLITNFDQAWVRLTGARLGLTAFGCWRNDFLFTIETQYPPYDDGTITWISDLPIMNLLDIGGGVQFSHYIPANGTITTPHIVNPQYGSIANVSPSGDTTWLTFKGIKLMGKLCIDPKGFMQAAGMPGLAGLFGKEDLKVYGEAAVLGLANQDTVYPKVSERIPCMFGFNFPAFRLLDVFSLQLEYYDCPYPDNYVNIYPNEQFSGTPYPAINNLGAYTLADYQNDHWKWSVYANRFFGKDKHFGIIAQAARDHWRTSTYWDQAADYEEALIKPNQWYWVTKLIFIF